jgi:Kef-type K+ transport system membrane component KefB
MIPRGEVGLIFAQMGMSSGVLDKGLFSAITMMVMATTFMTPPLLRYLLSPQGNRKSHVPEEGDNDLF